MAIPIVYTEIQLKALFFAESEYPYTTNRDERFGSDGKDSGATIFLIGKASDRGKELVKRTEN